MGVDTAMARPALYCTSSNFCVDRLPCISAVAIESDTFSRKINLAGPACGDYEDDLVHAATPIARGNPRGLRPRHPLRHRGCGATVLVFIAGDDSIAAILHKAGRFESQIACTSRIFRPLHPGVFGATS